VKNQKKHAVFYDYKIIFRENIKTEGKKRTKMLDFQGKSGGKITEYTFPQK
jgi:hypothetical protein